MAKMCQYNRSYSARPTKKVFLILTEGTKTEPQYFLYIKSLMGSVVNIECPKRNHNSSPRAILKSMKSFINENNLYSTDEAWIVVDKDNWTDEQLKELYAWAKEKNNHYIALSNPNFEYWLLLHFEAGNKIYSAKTCKERLQGFLPEYDKGVDQSKFSLEQIQAAVQRAKARDTPPCETWPCETGKTTVYKLVDNFLIAHKASVTSSL